MNSYLLQPLGSDNNLVHMNKISRIVVFGLISLVVCYIVCSAYYSYKYSYRIDMKSYKSHLSFFKDTARRDVDTNFFVSCTRKTDALYHYIYKRYYYVSIWNFEDLKSASISEISINEKVNLGEINFSSAEVLNKNSTPEVTVGFGSFFKNRMDINIDEYSSVEKKIRTDKYAGFYGKVRRLSLANQERKHLILFDYKIAVHCLVVVYKGSKGFYFIMIDSKKAFDESIINILNLN